MVEGKIPMASRRQVTNKLRTVVPGRVHANSDDDRPGHRVDRERVDPQQRVSMDRQGRRRPEGHVPSPLLVFDSDNGSEFINHDVADWIRERDIAQTRSRPYKKNDQATVESKNNHVVRKHAFYWRYDTTAELALLVELWPLVSMRLNWRRPCQCCGSVPACVSPAGRSTC